MRARSRRPQVLRWFSAGVSVALAAVAVRGPAHAAGDPAHSAELFQSTASELDLGGDLFFYLEVEHLLEQAMEKAREVAGIFGEGDAPTAGAAVDRLDAFLRAQGVYDGTGIGVSSRPMGDGLYAVKSFLARTPSSPAPPFWSMLGGPPRRLAVLDFVPADAGMLASIEFRPSELWALIQAAVRDVGGAEAFERFQEALEGWGANTGVDLDAWMASLGGEMAVSIQLSRDRTVELPVGTETMEAPEPSLLLALSVRDETFLRLLVEQAQRADLPMDVLQEAGVEIHAALDFPDMPIPVRPALAFHEGIVLLGSHPDVLAAALSARRDGDGLLSQPAFRALAASLPTEHNGLTFVDERFNVLMQDLQTASLGAAPGPQAAIMAEILKRVAGWSSSGSAVGVRIVKPQGILSHSITPVSGRELVLTVAAMPVAMMAGAAIPATMQARERAAEVSLLNTVRMVDAAKEMWALDQNRNQGDPVTETDLAPYLYGGAVELPPGHALRINPVGEPPEIVRPDGSVLRLP